MSSSASGKSPSHLYFIALLPPSSIRKEIEAFKKEIRRNFGAKRALRLPAHITLQIPFRMEESKEAFLLKTLSKFAKEHKAFKVELSGFGKFAQNVLFIKISDHQTLVTLFEDLQKRLDRILELKSHEKAANIHPHITIASKDLGGHNFRLAWADFKDRDYQNSFKADSFHLFRHNGKTWDLYRKFKLN